MAVQSITLSNLELARFFLAFVLLLFSAHCLGALFHKSKMPRVIGEILAGFLMGPSVLGYLWPSTHDLIFNAFPAEGKLISLVSWLGLILLMFVSGFEIQRTFTREDKQISVAILLGATIIPFLAGVMAFYLYDFQPYTGPNGNTVSLVLVIAIAVAVTSIPVISKIFLDLNIINTRFAGIVLAVATVEDLVLWAVLAVATGLAVEDLSPVRIVSTLLFTSVFSGALLLVLSRLVRWTISSRVSFLVQSSPSRYALFACFFSVAIASLLDVNAVFGAFLAGVAIGTAPQEVFERPKAHVKEIGLVVFTPVYFAVVGLKLDLIHQFAPLFFLGFLLFSTTLKTGGILLVRRLIQKDWLSVFNLAIALNTRGGPGIVLATVAFDFGIINEAFFVALVLVAIATSLFAGYWLRFVLSKGWALLSP
jgi:Kef-type K+ transport system membrane component KefB